MALPAPPAPTSKARLPRTGPPACSQRADETQPIQHVGLPRSSRRPPQHIGAAQQRRPVCDALAAWRKATNLCGTVAIMPSTLPMAPSAASTPGKASAVTCIGMTIRSCPCSRKARVRPSGDLTWAIGSPRIGISRVCAAKAVKAGQSGRKQTHGRRVIAVCLPSTGGLLLVCCHACPLPASDGGCGAGTGIGVTATARQPPMRRKNDGYDELAGHLGMALHTARRGRGAACRHDGRGRRARS